MELIKSFKFKKFSSGEIHYATDAFENFKIFKEEVNQKIFLEHCELEQCLGLKLNHEYKISRLERNLGESFKIYKDINSRYRFEHKLWFLTRNDLEPFTNQETLTVDALMFFLFGQNTMIGVLDVNFDSNNPLLVSNFISMLQIISTDEKIMLINDLEYWFEIDPKEKSAHDKILSRRFFDKLKREIEFQQQDLKEIGKNALEVAILTNAFIGSTLSDKLSLKPNGSIKNIATSFGAFYGRHSNSNYNMINKLRDNSLLSSYTKENVDIAKENVVGYLQKMIDSINELKR
jgi:hypothetical protein